jgi:DNA polymerase-4
VVTPARGADFVAAVPVRRFHGVGPVTAEKMARLGIETGADLRAKSLEWLDEHFGAGSARYYHDLARGICHRQVKADRPYKSVSAEDTFMTDLADPDALLAELDRIGRHVWQRITAKSLSGRTVNLKVKYGDFQIVTRARSLDRPVAGEAEFLDIGFALLRGLLPPVKRIRLLGLGLSNLGEGERVAEPERELELPLDLA